MGEITVIESNTYAPSTFVSFDESGFQIKSYLSNEEAVNVEKSEISYLSRPRGRDIKAGSSNIIGDLAVFKILNKFFGGMKTKNMLFTVKFKNGRWIRGQTDTDTFFAMQDAYLNNKYPKKDAVE